MYWIIYLLILILGSGTLIPLIILLYRKKYSTLTNLILMVLAIFLMLMVTEFYFKNFFAEPDVSNTLARQNWKEWYHEEVKNSLGYRDIEWTDEMVAGKIKVMVAGDSFVAGAGIARLEDRFSNQLAMMLGDGYVVFNVGKNGLNTGQVITAITEYHYKPDILVFSYYINDIESISPPCKNAPHPLSKVPSLLSPIVDNSFSANFIYWRTARLVMAMSPDLRGECLVNAYNDDKIWWLHQQELLSVYEGTKSENIPLFVVVFPPMFYLDKAATSTGKVVNLYHEQDVPVVDVASLVKDIPPTERVAGPMETHAGILTNEIVAKALYEELVEQDLVK